MGFPRPALIFGVVIGLLVTAGSAIVWVRTRQPPPAVAARAIAFVNGSPITADDVDVRLEQILPIASYHGNVAPDRLVALKRAALDDLVLDELIYREAVVEGRRAAAGAVETEFAAVKARFDSTEQFAAAIHENGLTERQFRERLARTVLVREARAAHARQSITERDITAYYEENAAQFQRPERVHLLEILFRADPAERPSAVAAERKARATLARLRRGEDFSTIARASSEDEYRVKDGDMGFVHRGRLDADFEAAVFAAVPGRFQIAHSLYGFQVFKVVERQPATQLSLDEARPIIAERLERQRRQETLQAWHSRLLAGARIDIRDPVLRRARAAELALSPDSLAVGRRVATRAASRSQQ